jgi:hypothetical protein
MNCVYGSAEEEKGAPVRTQLEQSQIAANFSLVERLEGFVDAALKHHERCSKTEIQYVTLYCDLIYRPLYMNE